MCRSAVILLGVGAAGALSVAASAATVSFQNGLKGYTGTQDTYLTSGSQVDNSQGSNSLGILAKTGSQLAVGLLKFDLSSLAHQVSSINSATLTVYGVGSSNYDPVNYPNIPFEIYDVASGNANWIAGATQSPATGGQATWNNKASFGVNDSSNVAWIGGPALGWGTESPTGYDTTAIGSGTFNSLNGQQKVYTISLDVTAVLNWINGTNGGMMIGIAKPNGNPNGNNVTFLPSEYAWAGGDDLNKRPLLTIDYNPTPEPATASLLLIGGGLLALKRKRN